MSMLASQMHISSSHHHCFRNATMSQASYDHYYAFQPKVFHTPLDQQTVAASNALFQLKHSRQSAIDTGGDMYNYQTSLKVDDQMVSLPWETAQNDALKSEILWDGRETLQNAALKSERLWDDELESQQSSATSSMPTEHYWDADQASNLPSQIYYNNYQPQSYLAWSAQTTADNFDSRAPSSGHTEQHQSSETVTVAGTRFPNGLPASHTDYEPTGDYDSNSGNANDIEEEDDEVPYAQLIRQALLEAPGHRLVLRDIYRWIEENTNKADDPKFKGWQNSIRHNLSMNKAFIKVSYTPDRTKRGFIWVLDNEAIEKGVEPTTRYRVKDHSKRSVNHGKFTGKDSKRQRSGRKGGRAARKSAATRDRFKAEGQWPVPYLERGINNLTIDSILASSGDDSAPSSVHHEALQSPYYATGPPLAMRSSFSGHTTHHYGYPPPWMYIKPEDDDLHDEVYTDNMPIFDVGPSTDRLPLNGFHSIV